MIVDNIGFRFSDYNTFLCENFCYVNFFKIQGLVTIVCYKYVAKNTVRKIFLKHMIWGNYSTA